jgi:hypothetical protein
MAPSTASTKYNRATATFRQLADNGRIYGLKFASAEDAQRFDDAMMPFAALSSPDSNGKQVLLIYFCCIRKSNMRCKASGSLTTSIKPICY